MISGGVYKGKTLGALAYEKPAALQWYVESYRGPDNILRAAAQKLISSAIA